MQRQRFGTNLELSASKKKRQAFTLEQKLKIVQEIENGKKKSDICRERNLTTSTIATIWKNRKRLMSAVGEQNIKTKKLRKPIYHDIDRALFKWYRQQKQIGAAINSRILQSKAEELNSKLNGTSDFRCSFSWIDRFKKRHNISQGIGTFTDQATDFIKKEPEEDSGSLYSNLSFSCPDISKTDTTICSESTTTSVNIDDDDDLLFFKSLLPDLKNLPREKKVYIRYRIQELILNEIYHRADKVEII